MHKIYKRAGTLYLLILAFCAGLIFLTGTLAIYAESWAVHPGNRNLYNKEGKLATGGGIYDRTGLMLADTGDGKRIFADSAGIRKATFHAVGDLDGYVATGIQTAFRAKLTGYDRLGGTFNMVGAGNNVHLTLDAALCETAMNGLGSRKGAVGVINYKTGELIAMASTPTFDPVNPPSVKELESDRYKGVYVNRLLSGQFAPGSIFKLVTAAAAIDNLPDIFEREYICDRGVEIDGEILTCMSRHGKIKFERALNFSCNAAFAQIALDMGQQTMLDYTKKLGFGGRFQVEGLTLAAGKYPLNGARNIDFGWSAIGQHQDSVNPMHYLLFISSIANGGIAKAPRFIDKIVTGYGLPQYWNPAPDRRMLPKETADTLKALMRSNVKNNYGESRFSGLNLCAKSGTAEIEKTDRPHSWFVGFMDDPEHPFAFVVVAENSGGGIGTAATIAQKVLTKAKELY